MQNGKFIIEDLRQPNFKPEEFLSSAKAKALGIKNEPGYGQLTCGVHLAKKMQALHDILSGHLKQKVVINVNSGFRNAQVNKAVGGSKTSKHLQFLACDFNIKGRTPEQAVALIKACNFNVDKCFVERGCVHIQFELNDAKNENFFGFAERIGDDWKVTKMV